MGADVLYCEALQFISHLRLLLDIRGYISPSNPNVGDIHDILLIGVG
jgi:hypothetical protein